MSMITVYDKVTNKVTPEGWQYLVAEMFRNYPRDQAIRGYYAQQQALAELAALAEGKPAPINPTTEGDTDEPRGPTATDPE